MPELRICGVAEREQREALTACGLRNKVPATVRFASIQLGNVIGVISVAEDKVAVSIRDDPAVGVRASGQLLDHEHLNGM